MSNLYPPAYLSSRGYGFIKEGNEDFVEALKQKFTVKPFISPNSPNAGKATEFPVYCESKKKIYIPKFYGLQHFGVPKPERDTLQDGDDAPRLIFQGALRPEQEEPVALFLEATRDPERRGGIISVPCGFGKTACGLYIACQLKKKTMVVCHKEFLMNQWRERIEQFIPTAKIGLIKQSKVITEDCDIILASLQSLAMRDYPSCTFKGIHFVVIDEIHHTSAEVFSRCLPKITTPVSLGLSATLKRADGLSKVFEWYVGKPVFVSKRRDASLQVSVLPYTDSDPFSPYAQEIQMWNGKLNVAQMITQLCASPSRNEFILNHLQMLLEREPEPGRKTLILSDRRAHLKEFEKQLLRRKMGTVGYYVGGMKEQDLKESESKDFILGTFTMACVSDTTIMVDPISGRERELREFEEYCKDRSWQTQGQVIPMVSMYPSTESCHISHCTRFGYSPQKPCVRIRHELGEIVVSKDHKIYTNSGWKPAGELTVNDYVVTPQRLDVKTQDMAEVCNQDLWMIACMMGQTNCDKITLEDSIYELTNRIIADSPIAKELWMIYVLQCKQQTESYFGLDMMFLPEEKLCSLIGGLFDGCGFIDMYSNPHRFHIYFVIDSLRLTNQLRTLLLRLGIRTTRSRYVKPGYPYTVDIVPEYIRRFANLIDVRGTTKRERLQEICDSCKSLSSTSFSAVVSSLSEPRPEAKSPWISYVEIYDIEEVDATKVRLCDIEVPIHHNFLASDIIVHNSEGMDIPALNTLVLASPISSVEQSVGRIQRQKEHERTHIPTVLDIWDQFSLFKNQGFRRLQFYKKNKFDIQVQFQPQSRSQEIEFIDQDQDQDQDQE